MPIRPTTDTELAAARVVGEWVSGEPKDHSRIFLLEEGVAVDVLDGVVEDGDAVLVPHGHETIACPGFIVRYQGSAREIGDELFIGDRGVELQDYVAAAFVHIVGPTAVLVVDEHGRQAFAEDAAIARRTGVFPSSLIDPRVILADRGALAHPAAVDVPRTFRISADGRVGVGVGGDDIGHVDHLRGLVSAPRPRCLGGGTTGEPHRILRFLLATDLMKMLRLANGDARISGFGWELVNDGEEDAEPRPSDPFLLDTSEGFVLADTGTLRRQLLAPLTAQVVAVTQTSTTLEIATGRLARRLGLSRRDAEALSLEAVDVLGIHHGSLIAAHAPETDG